MTPRIWCAALVIGSCLLHGCTSSAYVEAEGPVDVYAYPRVYDRGYIYYWDGDRWYVQRHGAWFYYRTEPIFLYRHRQRWYGPPAYHHHYYYRPSYAPYRHAAPPARRYAPPARRSAPPARRSAPPARRRH